MAELIEDLIADTLQAKSLGPITHIPVCIEKYPLHNKSIIVKFAVFKLLNLAMKDTFWIGRDIPLTRSQRMICAKIAGSIASCYRIDPDQTLIDIEGNTINEYISDGSQLLKDAFNESFQQGVRIFSVL
jgi:hypothetical protein